MKTRKQARGKRDPRRFFLLITAALLAVILVTSGTLIYLSGSLPEKTGDTFQQPAAGFNFAFGSGNPSGDLMLVDQFADGYALLSSGRVNIQADNYRVLSYTWVPPQMLQEAAFFWRRAVDPQNVTRTDITIPGNRLIDLSAEPEWQGEVIEFGFLLAGDNGKAVEIGEVSLIPDSLNIRLQLAWKAWITFEEWSQQSINFLHGGDFRQVVALPLLMVAWLVLTLLFMWLFQRFGTNHESRSMLTIAVMLFLVSWMLLDIRWATNNLKQISLSLDSYLQKDEQQRLSSELDGEIYQYVQRLKSTLLGNQNARILIVGDENAIDYYTSRAKYHLLPHSAHVTGRFAKELAPENIDFVLFFGDPANIVNMPGWNRGWQMALAKIDSGKWGAVFRVKKQ
jgi:hypothetical protein